jgi:hypothetical protein
MVRSRSKHGYRSRELRRRVVLPARLRSGAQWSDVCILNISSRGLMIHSARVSAKGSMVELRRGEHVIVARVMWREGARAGLHSDERLPIEKLATLGQPQPLRVASEDGKFVERRKRPRPQDDARLRGRAMEFIGVGAIGVTLALGAWTIASEAFARPLETVRNALG